MRYEIEHRGEGLQGFQPYSLTLHVDTHSDHVALHDQAIIRLAQSGDFIGAVYSAKLDDKDERERFPLNGDVPLKDEGVWPQLAAKDQRIAELEAQVDVMYDDAEILLGEMERTKARIAELQSELCDEQAEPMVYLVEATGHDAQRVVAVCTTMELADDVCAKCRRWLTDLGQHLVNTTFDDDAPEEHSAPPFPGLSCLYQSANVIPMPIIDTGRPVNSGSGDTTYGEDIRPFMKGPLVLPDEPAKEGEG